MSMLDALLIAAAATPFIVGLYIFAILGGLAVYALTKMGK